jgi:hypothetical protein
MANYARILPSKRWGLTADPEEAWFAPTATMIGTTKGWNTGAPLSYGTVGTQAAPTGGTVAGMLTEGGWATAGAPVNPAVTFLGFASEPYSPSVTATGGTAIGTEQLAAVGAGTTINGVTRRLYPCGPQIKFVGTLDGSGAVAAVALSLADVGSYFVIRAIRTDTGASIGALPNTTVDPSLVVWILDRTGAPALNAAPNTVSVALVTRLIDPPGAKVTDSPSAGVNSGQSKVEFVIVNLDAAGGVLLGSQYV